MLLNTVEADQEASALKKTLRPRPKSCFSSSVVRSYSGGSEELSDDITQQQLLPGVKYVTTSSTNQQR